MKLITITDELELLIIERPMTATAIKLSQQEVNELAGKCDKFRTDKMRDYEIPYIGDEKLK